MLLYVAECVVVKHLPDMQDHLALFTELLGPVPSSQRVSA